MFLVFHILYYIAWSLALPVLILMALTIVPKWRHGLKMRLGNLDQEAFPEINQKKSSHLQGPLWFHAVSVGELNALIPLLKFFAGLRIVLSVTTETAYKMAEVKLKDDLENNQIKIFYMPWDHPHIVSKVLTRVNPCALILMESEIWPGIMIEAKRRNIPIAVCNAKLSDSSFSLYQAFSFIFRPIFKMISILIAQSAEDSRKYLRMGVDPEKVFMMGNMKFSTTNSVDRDDAKEFRKMLGYQDDDIILTCGSTHEEEEALLVSIFQELKDHFPNLRLVLAPRHPERFDIVENFINSAAHLIPYKLSEMKKAIFLANKLNPETKANLDDILAASTIDDVEMKKISSTDDVLLVDTIGDLMNIYAISNIAIVGGTINDKIGGHNVLEPASCTIPVVIGPYYHKNTAMVELLEEAGGLLVAETKEDIRLILQSLIADNDRRILLGAYAKDLIEQNKKISYDVAQKLKECLLKK